MSQIPSNSLPTGGFLPTPRPVSSLPQPEMRILPHPMPKPMPPPFPRPPPHNPMDRLQTPQRSARLADKQGDQLEDIQRGVKDGSISQQEATRLLDQQARIADATARATADGVVTSAEAKSIHQLQARADASIFEAGSTMEYGIHGSDLATKRIQAAQIGNIAEGIRSGSLTGSEAGSLLRDQATIARVADKADGFFPDPLSKLDVALRQLRAAHNIRNEKSDFETAPHKRPIVFDGPVF